MTTYWHLMPQRRTAETTNQENRLRRLITITCVMACACLLWMAHDTPASTVSQARAEVQRLWGTSAARMICVIGRESGWKPWEINWSDHHRSGPGSFGLAQIGRDHAYTYLGGDWRRLLDPVVNVRIAYRVYRSQGWGAWRNTVRYC